MVVASDVTTMTLPDHLIVDGILDSRGSTSGGSVDIAGGGALRFIDSPSGRLQPDLVLDGTLSGDPTGESGWSPPTARASATRTCSSGPRAA